MVVFPSAQLRAVTGKWQAGEALEDRYTRLCQFEI